MKTKPAFPNSSPTEIAREIATFKANYGQIIKNVGKYVLIHGNTIVDYFDSYAEATNAGYKEFGLDSFLVRHIEPTPQPIRALRYGLAKLRRKLVPC
jgi:hypothetical protein